MPPNQKKKHSDGFPLNFEIKRGQTQKNVNRTVLLNLLRIYKQDTAIKVLDLPSGNMEFLQYVKLLFPNSKLFGADIEPIQPQENVTFTKMDLTKTFTLSENEVW
jgi:hypothetical protein